MERDELFHAKARLAFPKDRGKLEPGSKKFWVAVLHHDRNSTDQLDELCFLWIKGHGKITIQKVRAACRGSLASPNVEVDFDLRLGDLTPSSETLLKDLNFFDDNLVVLRVEPHEKKSAKTQPPRSTGIPGVVDDDSMGGDISSLRRRSPTQQTAGEEAHTATSNCSGFPTDTQPLPTRFSNDPTTSAYRASLLSTFPPTGQTPAYAQESVRTPSASATKLSASIPRLNTSTSSHSHRSPLMSVPPPNIQSSAYGQGPGTSPPASTHHSPSMDASPSVMSYSQWEGPFVSASENHSAPYYQHIAPNPPPQASLAPRTTISPATAGAASLQYPTHGAYSSTGTPLAVRQPLPGMYPGDSSRDERYPWYMVDEQGPPHVKSEMAQQTTPSFPPEYHESFQQPSVKAEEQPTASSPDSKFEGSPVPSETKDEYSFQDDDEEEVTGPERRGEEYLKKLIAQDNAKILEAGVAKALGVISTLKQCLSEGEGFSQDAQQWIQSLSHVEKQAERKRTVVGVVGNTGAGKSSVINALLDEERLVPTNCMRACTAVVTEMSWNNNDNPDAAYRAEIEFISPNDWLKELELLLNELLTEGGNISKEATDENSDAGIAYAKFKAVYPKYTREMLENVDVPSLMKEHTVVSVLGTTRTIQEKKPETFYRKLQNYVDSKEKTTGREKEKGKKKPPREMELWPLIKVVRIYTKSPALSTGAVIVDLPGVHDSNAARAAVAQGYLKQCTGLWIVAPINRAVDDKAAKTLLGDSFKRQLKYDGGLGNVTFICSKTDDISVTEAADSLELDDEIAEFEQRQIELSHEIKDLERKIEEIKDDRIGCRKKVEYIDEDLETWEKLQDDVDDGITVFAPRAVPLKRKRGASSGKARKRLQRSRSDSGDDSDEDFVVSDNEDEDSDGDDSPAGENDSDRTPLTADEIKSKISTMKQEKKDARRRVTELDDQLQEMHQQIKELKREEKSIRSEMMAVCIAGRNDYSKGAIQRDFAAGIKELDQETAAEEDEENFNPDEDLRDYDEVARSLPVFCVSSRAYQKLSGRLVKDEPVPGFKTKDETEMPQLQAHCKKLTEAVRKQACRQFLVSFTQQLNSMYLWASNDGTGMKLTDEERRGEVQFLDRKLKELEKNLDHAVERCVKTMKQHLSDHIFSRYPEVIDEAANAAPSTAAQWGGLVWAIYKATVRRDGVYESRAAGKQDFNAALTEPIEKKLATGWERAFQRRIPTVLAKYASDSAQILSNFHHVIEQRARINGAGIVHMQMLSQQVYNYEQIFQGLVAVLQEKMMELQRDANREFTPVIVSIMHSVYEVCTVERGSGSYKRMKDAMISFVGENRHTLFTEATKAVKDRLNQMCRELEGMMSAKSDEIFVHMRRDYLSLIGGAQLTVEVDMSKAERAWRAEVMEQLGKVDDVFKDEEHASDEEQSTKDNEEVPTKEDDELATEGDDQVSTKESEETSMRED